MKKNLGWEIHKPAKQLFAIIIKYYALYITVDVSLYMIASTVGYLLQHHHKNMSPVLHYDIIMAMTS